MSYPKPCKKTLIGVQNARVITPSGEKNIQIPVIFYGKLPNTFQTCKESGCSNKRLSGTARCKDHVRQHH